MLKPEMMSSTRKAWLGRMDFCAKPKGIVGAVSECAMGCRTIFDVAFTFEERVMEQLVEGIFQPAAHP